MLVQQSVQTQVGTVQELPKNVLAGLVIGQRVDAVVMTAAAVAEIVSIKVADTLLDIRSSIALQAGQKIQLELAVENGKPVLKLVPPTAVSEAASLKPGQQVAVEVLKILADNKVLLQTALVAANKNQATSAQQTIEVDISQLTQRHKVGDKLQMEVVSLKPLSIQLRPEQALSREQIILDKIRQLLPQQAASPSLKKVMNSFQNQQLPEPIQKAVQQLVQSIVDKTELKNPQAFKQAVVSSGVAMEQHLLKPPQQGTVNVKQAIVSATVMEQALVKQPKQSTARVQQAITTIAALEQAVQQAKQNTPSGKQITAPSSVMQQALLKQPIQGALNGKQASAASINMEPSLFKQPNLGTQNNKQALISSSVAMEQQIVKQPNQSTQDFKANLLNVLKAVETVIADNKTILSDKAINRLPAQVQAALTANGRTPAQLINTLLSGKSVSSVLSSLSTATTATTPSIISQQQAASLLALLNKPLVPNQQAVNRHVPMDLIELMQLFKEVEGVHNKIQLNQLNMLKEPESGSTVASWLFDVPIKDKHALDIVQLQIDQHKQSSEDEQDNDIWNVKLRLDTQNLGPVQATVTLYQQDVKVIVRAERADSAQLLTDNLAILEQALDKLGVSMSHSSCSCGRVEKAVNITAVNDHVSESLLDVSV